MQKYIYPLFLYMVSVIKIPKLNLCEKATPDTDLCPLCSANNCNIMNTLGHMSKCPYFIKALDQKDAIIKVKLKGDEDE